MNKILVVDKRRMINDGLKMQIMIEDVEDLYDVTVCSPESTEDLKRSIQGKYFDFVLVEHDMLGEICTPKHFNGVKIYGYASEKKELDNFDHYKMPYLGLAHKAEDLLQIIERICQGKAVNVVDTDKNTPTEKNNKPNTRQVIKDIDDEEEEEIVDPSEAFKRAKQPAKEDVAPEKPAAYPRSADSSARQEEIKDQTPTRKNSKPSAQVPSRPAERRSEEKVKEFQLTSYNEYEERPHEMHEPERKTRVVSVYSAKGGVGKSTLSANIALYLSMMDHGRGKYKVCLVDYNIESGDVRTILGFKGEKLVDMGIWAEDIHEQLLRHANPDDITFTREQIYRYLEPYHDKTGLYVLLAPQLHENAQFIEANEIRVMLDNIIKYGDFDFVICDTADNTSDSSYCALEASDTVFLVCTQDVTTATRNDSVLRSLKHTGMDMTKFRIIINNVTSKHKAGVSVSEIESYFDGYECVGRIHENSAVLHANNYASPLVLKPKNSFTEDLRNVVLYLLKNKGTDKKPTKKGLFSRK